MSLLNIKVLSQLPKIKVDGKTLTRINSVSALRVCIETILPLQAVRIKLDGASIAQAYFSDKEKTLSTKGKYYANLWFEILDKSEQSVSLTLEVVFFGFSIPVKKINCFIADFESNPLARQSDAFIDPSLVRTDFGGQLILDQRVDLLPAVVRSSSVKSLTKEVKKILVIRADQIGDLVLTATAFLELKRIFKGAEIVALVSPSNVAMARALDLFSEIKIVDFLFKEKTNFREMSEEAKRKVSEEFKDQRFDLAIDLSPMPESRNLLGLINASYKVGFENVDSSALDLGVLLHAKDPLNALSNVSHASYPLLMVDAVRHALAPEFIHLPADRLKEDLLSEFCLMAKNYIVVHSGARNLLVRWPLEKFVEIALKIAQGGRRVVFFSDDKIEPKYYTQLKDSENIHLIEQGMTFEKFDAITSFAAAFIGNDTGPKHLAALRGVPVISIHSPRTNWGEWGQIDSGYIISRRVPCAGCAILTKEECARDLACVRDIKTSDVLAAFDTLLAQIDVAEKIAPKAVSCDAQN